MNTPQGKSLHKAVLSLGSNVYGSRSNNLMGALNMIGRNIGRITDVSNFYETQPYGPNSGNTPYLNAVAIVETPFCKDKIESQLKDIEDATGRDRMSTNHNITIDIDLVILDGQILRPCEIERDYFIRGWKEVKRYV